MTFAIFERRDDAPIYQRKIWFFYNLRLITTKSEQMEGETLSEFYFDPQEDSIFRSRQEQRKWTRSWFETSKNIDFDDDNDKLSDLHFSLS